MSSPKLVLRTMYIDPDVDDRLRTMAFDKNTSKNDLLRNFLQLGMKVAAKKKLDPAKLNFSDIDEDALSSILGITPTRKSTRARKPGSATGVEMRKAPKKTVGRKKAAA